MVHIHAVHGRNTLLVVQFREHPCELPDQIQVVHIHFSQEFFEQVCLVFGTVHGLDEVLEEVVFEEELGRFDDLEEALLGARRIVDGMVALLIRPIVHHDVLIERYRFLNFWV